MYCVATPILIGLFIIMGFGALISHDEAKAAKYQRDKEQKTTKIIVVDVNDLDKMSEKDFNKLQFQG